MEYTKDQEIEILQYCRQHGHKATRRRYNGLTNYMINKMNATHNILEIKKRNGVPRSRLRQWNEKFKIYKPKLKRIFVTEQKYVIIDAYDKYGADAVEYAYGVTPNLITLWRHQLGLVVRRWYLDMVKQGLIAPSR